MIDWGRIPSGSVASLYWPQVLTSDVITLAQQFYGTTPLTAMKAHTIKIPITGGLSYIPIPKGGGKNFAGLFTVDLPSSVRSGESYDITVKRIRDTLRPAAATTNARLRQYRRSKHTATRRSTDGTRKRRTTRTIRTAIPRRTLTPRRPSSRSRRSRPSSAGGM